MKIYHRLNKVENNNLLIIFMILGINCQQAFPFLLCLGLGFTVFFLFNLF